MKATGSADVPIVWTNPNRHDTVALVFHTPVQQLEHEPIADMSADPHDTFVEWFDHASNEVPQAEALSLATVSASGKPTVRVVLYKGFSGDGFSFYTNYESQKAGDLTVNPIAAMLFFWQPLARQIRIEGKIERLSRDESESYFASRDRESQLGAWASAQSRPIASRASLIAETEKVRERFDASDVSCPQHWGGYRLIPSRFEFWQGRPHRLHDRFVYVRGHEGWSLEQLAP